MTTPSEPATQTEVKARNGVWTPWSLVLCVECDHAALKDTPRAQHYARHFEVVAKMDRAAEVARPSEGQLIGVCNVCHRECWVRSDVAMLQRVGFKASELDWEGPFGWELEQTGGMCAALAFSTEGRRIVVTASDVSSGFYVGEYEVTEGEEEWWDHPLRTWESAPLYGSDAQDSALVEECARKVIEFVRTPGNAS